MQALVILEFDDSDGTNWFAIDSDGAATFEGRMWRN